MNFLKKHFKVLVLGVGVIVALSSIGLEARWGRRWGYRRGYGRGWYGRGWGGYRGYYAPYYGPYYGYPYYGAGVNVGPFGFYI